MLHFTRNQKGVSIIQLIIYLAIAALVIVGGLAVASTFFVKGNSSQIESNKVNLESAARSYYTNTENYPTQPVRPFDESNLDTHVSKFFKQIAYFSGLSVVSLYEGDKKEFASDYDPAYTIPLTDPVKQKIDDVIMKRVLNLDIGGMVSNKYLAKKPKDPGNYFIHTTTGIVYYVDESMSIKEISEEAKRLVTDSGGLANLTTLDSFTLEKDGKKMERIITSVTNGDVIIYGGSGTMVLAKVKITKDSNGAVSYSITDLSSTLLQGGTTEGVTELRLIDNTKVLAHYFQEPNASTGADGKMMYRTIGIN